MNIHALPEVVNCIDLLTDGICSLVQRNLNRRIKSFESMIPKLSFHADRFEIDGRQFVSAPFVRVGSWAQSPQQKSVSQASFGCQLACRSDITEVTTGSRIATRRVSRGRSTKPQQSTEKENLPTV